MPCACLGETANASRPAASTPQSPGHVDRALQRHKDTAPERLTALLGPAHSLGAGTRSCPDLEVAIQFERELRAWLAQARDGRQNIVRRLGPAQGFGVLIVLCNE